MIKYPPEMYDKTNKNTVIIASDFKIWNVFVTVSVPGH